MMGTMVPETCWASNNICNKNHLLHLVGILFPHINDDARSKSLQRYRMGLTLYRVDCVPYLNTVGVSTRLCLVQTLPVNDHGS
jgi:hypothetical protein